MMILHAVTLLAELGIPDGQVVDRYRGGEGVLKKVLEDVRKYAFSGYVKLEFELNVDRAEGAVAFNSGEPVVALYVFKKGGALRPERVYKGGKAVEFVWEDSLLPESSISLHSRVSAQDMERSHPDAKIGKVELVPPPNLTNPRSVGDVQKLVGKGDEVAHRINDWAREGYNVSNLIRLYVTDPQAAARSLPYFESNIQRLEGLEEILRFLDTQGYEREAESLMRKMRDPERLLDVEAELESLRRRIEGYEELPEETPQAQIHRDMERKRVDEKIDGVYDLIMQYHKQITTQEVAAVKCPRCGGSMDPEGACPTCPPAAAKTVYGRPLNPRYSFEHFVVGPNSRFAEAAAKAVASAPGKSYNPLFIYSRSGLGKTHLLQAIGNQIAKDPKYAIILAPTDALETEIINAIQERTLDQLRATYRGADVLLIDDVQFLAGKERMQEELFQIFNIIMERGGQVVLTSDRPPKEIPSLSERLVTRFESGLIADIQPPELETRMAILDRRVKVDGLQVPREVLTLIAEACRDNVRQLEGGLNRVVAFSSLLKADITLERAQEILGMEPPKPQRKPARSELADGHSYLVEEDKPDLAHRLLLAKAREGYSALGIVRGHPKTLRARGGDADLTLLWLTDRESEKERTVPPSLERLVSIIEAFVEEKRRTVVLLDDIQYLVSNNSFEGVVRFLRNVVDNISERSAVFMVSLSPDSLGPQERSILEREMEVLRQVRSE
ncbi:MAG: DnaA/Hda family protein [Methanomassiliicoccales archaeon]|nr:DnaA/Hda family protein [Methanomassiliicoccales archaeon]